MITNQVNSLRGKWLHESENTLKIDQSIWSSVYLKWSVVLGLGPMRTSKLIMSVEGVYVAY